MSFLNVKNNASSKLASAITAVATSLTVLTGEGARFPSSNFPITIDNEILLCSSRTGDVLTVTRAQESTSATVHGQGAAVRHNITAAIVTGLQKQVWDSDGDTGIQVEESADEDKIRMDVKGVEAFVLHDDGILDVAKQSAAYAYRATTNQTIPTTDWTKVQLNAELFDIQSEFDSVTNYRFTAKKAGLYALSARAGFAANVTGRRGVGFNKNGVITISNIVAALAAGSSVVFANGALQLAAGDYIELVVLQESGGDLDISASTGAGTFMIIYKGA